MNITIVHWLKYPNCRSPFENEDLALNKDIWEIVSILKVIYSLPYNDLLPENLKDKSLSKNFR